MGREDGYRAGQRPGELRAVFCRLEHVIPWSIQGARWDSGPPAQPPAADRPATCSHCGEPLGDSHVLLVRHRDEHRIPDAFCSLEHMVEWAKAGGRWR